MSVTFTRFIAYAMGGVETASSSSERRITSGEPNREYLKRVVGTQQVLFNWMSLIVFFLLISVGSWTLLNPIKQLAHPTDGWIAWVLVIIGTTINFWGNAYAVYLQGINRITEFRRYETFFSLGSILGSSIVLLWDANLMTLIAINQFWVIASVARNRYLCIKYNEGGFEQNNKVIFDRIILCEIWPSAWKSGLGVLMSYGLIQSSSLFYAQNSHIAQVSSYLFAMRVMQLILTFAQAPFYSKLPILSQLYAKGKTVEIIQLAQTGMMRAHWVFVIGVVSVAILASPIMKLIGSQILFVDPKLWALISLSFFIERYGAMHLQLYSISNQIVWHIANGMTGTIYIICTLWLYRSIGVYSFPISLIISYSMFYTWFSTLKSVREFKMDLWKFETRSALIPVIIIIFTVVLAYN